LVLWICTKLARNIVSEAGLARTAEGLQAPLGEQLRVTGCCADHHSANEDGQMTEHGQFTDAFPKLLLQDAEKIGGGSETV
jgi:hypothetical protein